MAYNLGVMEASVVLNSKSFEEGLNQLPGKAESSFKKVAGLAAAYLSLRQLSGLLASSVKAYSDLEEATSKFEVVFSGLVDKQREYVNLLKEQAGASNYSAIKMLGDTGDILTGFGFDREMALDMSYLAAQLGADLTSFSNYAGGAEGATNALTKAMLGETESAKMLGVVIRQDDANYKSLIEQAMTAGVTIGNTGRTITASSMQQAKAVAALAMAYQQSPNAIGDVVRTQNSLVNQTRLLSNNFLTLKQNIGEGLRDDTTQAIQLLNGLLKGVNAINPEIMSLVIHMGALSAGLAAMSKLGILKAGNNLLSGLSGVKQKAFAEAALARTRLAAATEALSIAEAKAAAAGAGNLAATEALAAAKAEQTAATAACTLAENRAAAASTFMGRAKLFATGAARSLSMAMKGLLMALGPLGVAMLGIASVWGLVSYQQNREKREVEGRINLAGKQTEAARAQAKANAEKRQEDAKHIERLREMSKYEKLNASEQEEAQKRIAALKEQYKDLGIELDETTGRLKIQAEAWENLTQKQREQAFNDTLTEANALGEQINAKASGATVMLGGRSVWGKEADARRDNQMLRIEMAQESPLEDRLATYKELEIEALSLNDDELALKMQDLIKDTERLIELQKRAADIKTNGIIDEEGATPVTPVIETSFSEEERSYNDYLAKRERERSLAGVDRELDNLERSGNHEQYQTMLSGLVDRYNTELDVLKEDYRRTIESAKQDGVMSDTERRAIADARRKIEETQDLADRYADRAIRDTEEPTREMANATVAFSSELLSAMLGAATPQEETAENTKQMRSILQRMENKSGAAALQYGE